MVVAIFAGDAIAGEATWGNLRYTLVRPVGRARLLASKLAMSLVFVAIATLLIVVTGLLAGGIAFGWHRIDVDFAGFFSLHKSSTQLLAELGIASAYVAWNMTSIVAMALMVSTMTDSSNGAIGAGIGLFMTSSILDAIPQLGSLRNGLPTHYLDDWRGLIVRHNYGFGRVLFVGDRVLVVQAQRRALVKERSRRAAASAASNRPLTSQTGRTFCASSPFRPCPMSNSTV